MSIKEFTLQKGFNLPVLKALEVLGKGSNLREIFDCLEKENLFAQREADVEKIDFSGRARFEYAVEACMEKLTLQGFVTVSGETYTLSESGKKELSEKWSSYNQNEFVKKIDVANKNKYTYFNIPPYLLYSGHKQVTVSGFDGFDNQYVKLLNNLTDYIDLNYPTMDEMISFLKYNYDIEDSGLCINAINIIRTSGLSKIMGRNLSLTKLGQWYINSYNYIALFKIFANRYLGFEEIFTIAALNGSISVENLRHVLLTKYNFDWVGTSQFDIRISWLEGMEVFQRDGDNLSLSNEALELAEFLGLINLDEAKQTSQPKVVIPTPTEVENKVESVDNVFETIEEDDFNFTYEMDNIIEDIVAKTMEAEHLQADLEASLEPAESDSVPEAAPKEEARPFKEPEENLDDITNVFDENVGEFDFEDTKETEKPQEVFEIFDDLKDEPEVEEVTQKASEVEVKAEPAKPQKHSTVVVKIPSKSNNPAKHYIHNIDEHESKELYIEPSEIDKLINLPKEINSKIASALNMGKHIILTGPHGSGKTSIAVILAKLAQQKGLNNGYYLASANDHWTYLDTIGGLVEGEQSKVFKEGIALKSIRENKWLIIDEICKCDTYKCFSDFANALDGYNTILPIVNENYKNIEIVCEPIDEIGGNNQYIKSKDWRLIATLDTSDKSHMNFSPAFIRRFAFIEIGVNNYSSLIDEYFIKNELQNDLLKTKIKTIFSQNGLLKFKDVGSSSIYDLIQYISIRSKLMSDDESVQDILAEALELYIIPQLRILDEKVIKDAQEYLINVFDGYEDIMEYISKAL